MLFPCPDAGYTPPGARPAPPVGGTKGVVRRVSWVVTEISIIYQSIKALDFSGLQFDSVIQVFLYVLLILHILHVFSRCFTINNSAFTVSLDSVETHIRLEL